VPQDALRKNPVDSADAGCCTDASSIYNGAARRNFLPMFVRCAFCHKLILQWFYERHAQNHRQRRADGQQKDHVTNAPDDRYRGPLDKVPQVYNHPLCGGSTRMPEEIVRSYLANPLLYVDRTFCTGCGDYVDSAELFWIRTGENLMDYKGRLRAEYLQRVFGISQARQRKQVVVVTPPAEQAIRRFATQRGFSVPYSLALERRTEKSPAAPSYFWRIVDDWNPRSHTVVLDADEYQVVVPKVQEELFRGSLIHFPPGPQKGFTVSRLYAIHPGADG
jgi:hypothetical protein